jgi:hypothetical protein
MKLVRCRPLILSFFLTCACTCKSTGVNSTTNKPVTPVNASTQATMQVQVQGSCRPSFTPVSDNAIVAKLDPALEFGARLVLIGCESDLASITGAEKASIAQYLRQLLIKEHYMLAKKTLDRGFRQSTARKMNALLSRPKITDVLIFGIYSKEFKIE